MKEVFKQYCIHNKLFGSNDKILVAVSGGIDSCVLLHLLKSNNVPCTVAHCNFKLRGDDSERDEQFVKGLSDKYGFDFISTQFNTSQFAEENGVSIQMAARELRYQFFEDTLASTSCSFIATAHHADDSIETFYINLLHGTGLRGLTGIPLKKGNIIRPLLFATRRDIEEYAKENELLWRNDTSNFSNKYIRNRIRNQVIPVFDEIKPGFRSIMQRNVENLKESYVLFDELLKEKLKSIIHQKNNSIYLSIRELKKSASGKSLLFHILNQYGFDSRQTEKIWNTLDTSSGKMFYSREYVLNKDRDCIIISDIVQDSQHRKFYLDESVELITEPFEMSLEKHSWKTGNHISKESNQALVDAEKIVFPLIIRKWQAGDFFRPLGMNGFKKVSDFFIDQKISNIEKDKTWVIESSNRIVWLVGLRIDDRFKITSKTQSVLKLQLF